MRLWIATVLFAGLVFTGSYSANAQITREEFDALKSEVGALKERVQTQNELLRRFLEQRSAPREVPFKEMQIGLDGAAVYGTPDAKVTIVEFSDYQCPFCAQYSNDTFPQLEREYIDTGRVRYVFRDFPIEGIHPQAFKAHEAAHCAGEQGKRLEMHRKIFTNQQTMSVNDLTAHAVALGLDKAQFEKCLGQGMEASKVRNGLSAGAEAGVRGTPTFFVGLTEPNSSKLKAVRRIVGAQPYGAFKAAIDELLSTQ